MNLSTRMSIAMVALVLFTVGVLGAMTYSNVVTLLQPRALDRLGANARLTATVLEASLSGARADALAHATSMLRRLPQHDPVDDEWRGRVERRFVAEMFVKPNYARLRVVDDDGHELIRVDRSGDNGAIRIAPADQLTSLAGQRDVFQGLATAHGDVFTAPITLDRSPDGEEIPTLRVIAPIHGPDGAVRGAMVMDVDLRSAIAMIRSGARDGTKIVVVNEAGDYLLHPDPQREFGFARGQPHRIQDKFPAFAAMLLERDAVDPLVMEDRTGQRFGVGWQWAQLAGGPRVAVVEILAYASMMSIASAISNSTLIGGVLAVMWAIVMAIGVARSLTQPLVRITKAVEGFNSGETIALKPGGAREISLLADAFNRMSAESRRKTTALGAEIEERNRLTGVLDNTVSHMMDPVVVLDSEGTAILASPAAQRMFGGILGTSVKSPVKFRRFAPDGVTPLSATDGTLLRAFNGEVIANEVVVVQPMGSDERFHLVGNARQIRNEAGELQGAVAVYHDITQTLRAQEALNESERMARAIIDTALDAFVQIDPQGAITKWSPHAETLFGWTRDEALGKDFTRLVFAPNRHKGIAAGYARFIDSIEQGEPGFRVAIEAVRRDGSPVQIEVSMTTLLRDDGYVTNVFLRDLTEREIAEAQLRQAQKMESIGQLTGGIAHDFNNMLTVITGTIDILADAVADRPRLLAIARLISEAADRGAELTRHLLAFARKQPLQPCETNVNSLIGDLERLLKPTLGGQIEFERVLQQSVWPIFVDRGQLDAALVNLALNARDAMPNGGRLTLETCNVDLDYDLVKQIGEVEPGAYVMIAVSDTGIGIPAAIHDKVFDPFFTTKEVGKGTGLGLSMVYGFIKQSGGHVTLYSEPGHGTTLRIYLPRAKTEAGDETLSPPASGTVGGNETILIVEDDAMVRNYVTAQLERLGYTTLFAPDAAAALLIGDRGVRFDLLFTDIVMPGKMNGIELAAEMVKRHPYLKVLFTSGYSEGVASRNGGLDPEMLMLAKPYRRADLARMVRAALDAAPAGPEKWAASA
jgi:PAS domain S-box-containing protein